MNSSANPYNQQAQQGALLRRDELIVSHIPLVSLLVGKMSAKLPPHVDKEELLSAAYLGLVAAAERFDPNRGVKFKTFAEQRINGTIIDELRSQDWMTRPLREKLKSLDRKLYELEQQLGRNPASEEIAAFIGMELDDYFQLLDEVRGNSFTSLNDEWLGDDGSSYSLLDIIEDKGGENPQNQVMGRQMLEGLTKAIDSLPEKERIVVTLYYFEELNLKEIGEILDLTESRISQLNSQAHVRLRSKMKCY